MSLFLIFVWLMIHALKLLSKLFFCFVCFAIHLMIHIEIPNCFYDWRYHPLFGSKRNMWFGRTKRKTQFADFHGSHCLRNIGKRYSDKTHFLTLSYLFIDVNFTIKSLRGDLSRVSPSLIALTKGQRSKRQPLNSLWCPIYVFNSVDHTKLPSMGGK